MTYQIAILRHAYQPDVQGIETPRIYVDDRDTPIEFDRIDDARAIIGAWDNDVYVTSNNESGRPTYLIVESVDGDYVHGGRNGDASNYDWRNAECECGECGECNAMMIEQDRAYLIAYAAYKS